MFYLSLPNWYIQRSVFSGWDDLFKEEEPTNKDYKKVEDEVVSKDSKTKTITVKESWTNDSGMSCSRTTTKIVPNISKEELEKTAKIKQLRAEIKSAVEKEDYETAMNKKKELQKLE